ncbi:MAG: S24 family peptidase, partial [Gammaproteobacteria bacterium]
MTGHHDSASDVFASEVLDATCLERTPSSWQDFTVLQAEILARVEQCMDERGVVPSVNDILYRSPFQYSRALSRALDRLLANNWLNLPTQGEGVVTSSTPLSRAASKPRSTTALISVPIVGERDAANSLSAPHAAPEGLMESVLPNGMRRCHGFLKIPATLFYLKPTYLVRVETNAMSAVGIVAGDMVAVQQRGVAWPGQVIVARIEGEVQIRRLGEASPSGLAPLSLRLNDKQEENGENQRVRTMASETVTLFPENPTYRPSVVMRDDLEIKGVMIGV